MKLKSSLFSSNHLCGPFFPILSISCPRSARYTQSYLLYLPFLELNTTQRNTAQLNHTPQKIKYKFNPYNLD